MVCTLHVIYRISPTRKSEVRPDWFSQRACLRSFIAAADEARTAHVSLRSTVIIDGELDADLRAELEWFDEKDQIRLLGNSLAFRHALEVALSGPEEITLFAEDDYMWTSGSILDTLKVLSDIPSAHYASPYAHPVVDDTSEQDARRHLPVTVSVSGKAWRSTPRTTMTFACRTSTLRAGRQYWKLASYGKSPKDSYAFWSLLEGRWFRLVGNAAFRDPRRVVNAASARVVAQSVSRRLRPATRPLLLQPAESLATHVHQPFITGGENWQALATAMDERSP